MFERTPHFFPHTSLRNLFALAFILIVFQGAFAEDLAPLELKAANGASVKIVAIHKVEPEGLTFSPLPDGPLIGSKKLLTISTEWANIDLESLKKYPPLHQAYAAAQQGKTTNLTFGPHFHPLSQSQKEILDHVPRVYYWSGIHRFSINLDRLVKEHGRYRPSSWYLPVKKLQSTLNLWKEVEAELEPIGYRSDVIRYRNKIRRAMDGLKAISANERSFDISAARKIDALFRAEM